MESLAGRTSEKSSFLQESRKTIINGDLNILSHRNIDEILIIKSCQYISTPEKITQIEKA
jgi:hypothetical protein